MAHSLHNLLSVSGIQVAGDVGPYTCYTNKNRKLVFFNRAPPKDPPTIRQLHQRGLFRLIAYDWRQYDSAQKAIWESITIRLSMKLTGYNLFSTVELKSWARDALPSLLRQAGIVAAPPYNIRGS